ncbi:MAG: ribosome silencing factor [Pseudomonadales bacterium]|jgi:ribosome-associated protein
MQNVEIKDLVIQSLEDVKGQDIVCLDVRKQTDIADFMVVACGTSNRQVKALVNNVVVDAKKMGVHVIGVEGQEQGDWVLIDLVDVIVHVMLPNVREYYDLERLWSMSPSKNEKEKE